MPPSARSPRRARLAPGGRRCPGPRASPSSDPMRLAILVSGRGTNLAAVLDAVADGRLRGVEPVLVVSNRSGVAALEVAARQGGPIRVLPRGESPDAGARDAAIGRAVTEAGADLALLAGYDQLLRPPHFAPFGGGAGATDTPPP